MTGPRDGYAAIGAAFDRARREARPAFIPYVTAGDPNPDGTRRIAAALGRGGADLIELGVPYSDPIADGPVNQRAAERALRAGVTLRSVLDLAARIRRDGTPPLILFTYYNPIHSMGPEEFARGAAAAGVSGVLVTDLPPEEGEGLREELRSRGLATIHLLAPTSSEGRIRRVAASAGGFLYVIARAGVTGARDDLPSGLPECLRRIRRVTGTLPLAVGFGISRAEQVRALSRHADGIVVGSAIVRLVEECGGRPDLEARVERLCRDLTGSGGPPPGGP